MIVIGTSAPIAILEAEPERQRFVSIIAGAPRRLASAVTVLEACMVARGRRGEAGLLEMRALIEQAEIEVVPFDSGQLALALEAFGRFGKGVNPAARLNLGDCCSFALAKGCAAPMLSRGADFINTDIVAAT